MIFVQDFFIFEYNLFLDKISTPKSWLKIIYMIIFLV